ncbi:unnamed protein product [Cladocopium goreaui]|uniref:Uncharacterized protein n=1 Tax=Cladocopium goreaui TaxID=2562237 RepID=A0A9P1GDZ1_9DINO|nr:unnamed protein product [Cladocopium goreaui]
MSSPSKTSPSQAEQAALQAAEAVAEEVALTQEHVDKVKTQPMKRPASKTTQPKAKSKPQAKRLKRPACQVDLANQSEDGNAEDKTEPEDAAKKVKNTAKAKDELKAKKLKLDEPKVADESAQKPAEVETSDKLTRDKGKAYYFHRNFQQLPEEVQKAFQGKDLNREQKTELVNAAVQRSQAGSYQFDMTSQVLRSLCTFTEKTTGEQTAKGLPRSLMVSKLGSEANLEKAMQAGEVTECTQGGRVYYVWNTVKITRAREAASQVKAESTVEASDAAVQSMALFVDNYKPTLGEDTYANAPAPTLQILGNATTPALSMSLPSASNGAGALNLQISGPTQISPQVLGKLDEALAWWAKARKQLANSLPHQRAAVRPCSYAKT